MKTIRHTARMSQPLHIEAPGCIVTIHAGLQTGEGRPFTAIQVICNTYVTGPWKLKNGEKIISLRVIKQVKGE